LFSARVHSVQKLTLKTFGGGINTVNSKRPTTPAGGELIFECDKGENNEEIVHLHKEECSTTEYFTNDSSVTGVSKATLFINKNGERIDVVGYMMLILLRIGRFLNIREKN